jgi:hypothetical protein
MAEHSASIIRAELNSSGESGSLRRRNGSLMTRVVDWSVKWGRILNRNSQVIQLPDLLAESQSRARSLGSNNFSIASSLKPLGRYIDRSASANATCMPCDRWSLTQRITFEGPHKYFSTNFSSLF